jgi:hypothetical protein
MSRCENLQVDHSKTSCTARALASEQMSIWVYGRRVIDWLRTSTDLGIILWSTIFISYLPIQRLDTPGVDSRPDSLRQMSIGARTYRDSSPCMSANVRCGLRIEGYSIYSCDPQISSSGPPVWLSLQGTIWCTNHATNWCAFHALLCTYK